MDTSFKMDTATFRSIVFNIAYESDFDVSFSFFSLAVLIVVKYHT